MEFKNILFVMESTNTGANNVPNPSIHCLIDSFNNSNCGCATIWFFNEHRNNNDIIDLCKKQNINLVVAEINQSCDPSVNLDSNIFATIKNELKIQIMFFWTDSVWGKATNYINQHPEIGNLHVFTDTDQEIKNNRILKPEQVIHKQPIYDISPFINRDIYKDIDVCYIGSIAYWPRTELAQKFSEMTNIKSIIKHGRESESFCSYEEYISSYKRSKTAYNTPYTANNSIQIKGRIWEILLCKSVLLEFQNPLLQNYLEPNKHYVACDTIDEIIDKVVYYSQNNNEADIIRNNGFTRALELNNPSQYWTDIFRELEKRPC